MTNLPTNELDIPAALVRVANERGVTLSGGEIAHVVDAAKTDEKPTKAKRSRKVKNVAPTEAAVETPVVEAAPTETPKETPVTESPAVGTDGQPLAKVSRSIVPIRFKAQYAKHGGTNGDQVALELKAATTTLNADKRETLDVPVLWAIAEANGIDYSKYVDLNNGQKRMNVANKLRGLLKAGKDIVIGTRTMKAEDIEDLLAKAA